MVSLVPPNDNSEPPRALCNTQGGKKARHRGWRSRDGVAADVALLQNTLINDSSEQIYLHY